MTSLAMGFTCYTFETVFFLTLFSKNKKIPDMSRRIGKNGSFMVFSAVEDLAGTVELLKQHDTGELVRKGHG